MAGGRFGGHLRDMVRKYGRVAVGVHLSVSGLCFSGCYLAILNSVDVEGILDKVGLGAWLPAQDSAAVPALPAPAAHGIPQAYQQGEASIHVASDQSRSGGASSEVASLGHARDGRTFGVPQAEGVQAMGNQQTGVLQEGSVAEEGKSGSWSLMKGGGAFALAWICNKALFPVRVPITIGLTPPIWRFLTSKGFRV